MDSGMIVFLFVLSVTSFLSWNPGMIVFKHVPTNIMNCFNKLVFQGQLQE